ncbi:MAG: aminoglycoside phosphotransferase family protein, partial [Tetragenococcus halophilus]|nr:aminoglycoside phosphotransferase family protein [Tetragenococcus halophilus]
MLRKKQAKLLELSTYLENGTYVFDTDFRMVFKTTKSNHPMVHNLNLPEKKEQLTTEIKHSETKYFNGSVLWFCINGDIKIFSDDKVLTLCFNKESYQRKIENYAYFSPFFRIPVLRKQDAKHNMLIEEFINFDEKTADDESFIFKTMYNNYRDYFTYLTRHTKVGYQTLNQLWEISAHTVYSPQFEKITKKIAPELFSMKFPFINLHGDMWSDNILLSHEQNGKTLWYIDWETADNYVFFYDFFKFIWNELDVHQDASFYKKYIAGEFDNELRHLFSIFDINFQPKLKQSYFCYFFLNAIINDTGRIAFKFKQEEIENFERKVFPLMT